MLEFRTRFAPSPTGYLHLGHAVSALYVLGVWRQLVQSAPSEMILRIEDHDQQRCREEYVQAIVEDLTWLGFKWDTVVRQSEQQSSSACYAAFELLRKKGLVYFCDCSRKAIQSRTASLGKEELFYDGHCRNRGLVDSSLTARLRIDRCGFSEPVEFFDGICGAVQQSPSVQCGDFALRDRKGNWTYQFAAVVDDLWQKVNLIVRGQDLLPSTARQLVLQRELGGLAAPRYFHHPLVYSDDGKKLSKSLQAPALKGLRAKGDSPEEVLGRAACLMNLGHGGAPIDLEALLGMFEAQLPISKESVDY